MDFDCSRCQINGDDHSIRKLKRKALEKLNVGENLKIYNKQGHLIDESDLFLLNQEKVAFSIVYVSSQNEYFDYETYIKMYRNVKKLGQGGYGLVFLGRHILTNEEYAIKFIMPGILKADEAGKAFKEAQTLQSLDHPNIIKLINVFQLSDTKIVLLMEPIEGGTLKEYIDSQGGKITEKEAQKLMLLIGDAINYCHRKDIVHRDIKLENILLNVKGDASKGIKIIDFGIAGIIQPTLEEHKAGTLRYSPPELISGQSYKADPSFDVWSLGILLFRMIYGCFPFDAESWQDTRKSIIQANLVFPQISGLEVSDTCKALLKLMLNKDPSKRAKLYQLIRHPWFTDNQVLFQLMNTNNLPQNTMMNFFKQELKQIQSKQSTKDIEVITDKEKIQTITRNKPNSLGKVSDKPSSYKNQYQNYNSPYANQNKMNLPIKSRFDSQINDDQEINVRNSLEKRKQSIKLAREFKSTRNAEDTYPEQKLQKSMRTRNKYENSNKRIKKLSLTLKKDFYENGLNSSQVTLPQIQGRRSESQLKQQEQLKVNEYNNIQAIDIQKISKVSSITSFKSFSLQNQQTLVTPHQQPGIIQNTERKFRVFELPTIYKNTPTSEDQIKIRTIFKSQNKESQDQQKFSFSKRQFSVMTGTGTTCATQIMDELNHRQDNKFKHANQFNLEGFQKLIETQQDAQNKNQQLKWNSIMQNKLITPHYQKNDTRQMKLKEPQTQKNSKSQKNQLINQNFSKRQSTKIPQNDYSLSNSRHKI